MVLSKKALVVNDIQSHIRGRLLMSTKELNYNTGLQVTRVLKDWRTLDNLTLSDDS